MALMATDAAAVIRRAQRQALAGLRSGANCITCERPRCHEPHSFAFLTMGALWMDRDGETGGPHPRMEAFFSLGWHGRHDDGRGRRMTGRAYVEVLDCVPLGQADLQFCSIRCLRRFFALIVDAMVGNSGTRKARAGANKLLRNRRPSNKRMQLTKRGNLVGARASRAARHRVALRN